MPPIAFICVYEIAFIRMKGVISCLGDMIIQDEVEGSTELSEADLVSIHESEVSGLVRINGVNLHVGGFGEGGRFVAHKPPGEFTELVKVKLVVGCEDVDVVPHVCIPVV